jgi:hypothetical protein
MWVKVADLAGGADTLRRAGVPATVDSDRLRVDISPDRAEAITRALVGGGHYPTELRPVDTSLEDAFFALTGEPVEGDA